METKKVLLLSCNTGQGHNAAAIAIAEYLKLQGVHCEVCDALAYISRPLSRFVAWGHTTLYRRAPRLFDWGWQKSLRRVGMFSPGSFFHHFLARGAEKLYPQLVQEGYTTVISTHALPAVMMTHLLTVHPMDMETAFVATDYTIYPSMEATDMDVCFLPAPEVAPPYLERGVKASTLRYAGIPVGRRHFAASDPRAACETLGLDPTRRQLVIMSGSMGCGPIPAILRALASDMPPESEVTVICGTNHRLCRKLTRRYGRIPGIHIVGFTRDVPLYMDAADLLLTKPGGISISEAAAHGVPMVLVAAVAGCETDNRTRLLELGAATIADTPAALADECRRLLGDHEARACMSDAIRNGGFDDGAAIIGQAILQGLKGELHEAPEKAPANC